MIAEENGKEGNTWLMGNFKIMKKPEESERQSSAGTDVANTIANLKGTHTIVLNGTKIGFIALCDEEWLSLHKCANDDEVPVY